MKKRYFIAVFLLVFVLSLCPLGTAFAEPNELEVYLGGTHLSVDMVADGLVVLDYADITTPEGTVSPAKSAGVEVGDVLRRIDDTPIRTRYDVQRALLEADGDPVTLSVYRDGQPLTLYAVPAWSQSDGYLLGVYLKDGLKGVGTLTYVRCDTHTFAALGHGVVDPDTDRLATPFRGKVYASHVVDIVKGRVGEAGELRGTLSEGSAVGTVTANTDLGLFGHAYEAMYQGLPRVKVATRDRVEEGDAVIVCALTSDSPRYYAIRITACRKQAAAGPKGISFRVTDSRLLSQTNGIVQGMSGSPILQNGRLVGAVTHVMMDDPAEGYGVYIDFMLDRG